MFLVYISEQSWTIASKKNNFLFFKPKKSLRDLWGCALHWTDIKRDEKRKFLRCCKCRRRVNLTDISYKPYNAQNAAFVVVAVSWSWFRDTV